MNSQKKLHRWWPFLLLLTFGASRWAVSAARPDTESTLASQAVGCAWATFLAFALLFPKPTATRQTKPPRELMLRWFFGGAMLLGGPAIAFLLPTLDLESSALTIALSLTPVIIAIAASALGTASSESIAGRIWPGLSAVAGLLLLLVQPSLGELRTDFALALAPTLTGIGAVLFCVGPARASFRLATALLGATTLFGIALAAGAFTRHALPPFSLPATAGDGIMALLGVVTLNQLGATRWSSQFSWVPLLVICEGIVMIRPQLTAHWFVGLILLVVAGVYLLLPQVEESSQDPSPIRTVLH